MAPVLALLRHFHTEVDPGSTVLTIRFEEIASRSEMPVKIVSDSCLDSVLRYQTVHGDSLRSLWRL